MSDINEETSTEYSGDYPEIAAAYKAGEELTDEQLDTIADVAISILRSILGYFDASDSPIDEYEGDEGELILDVDVYKRQVEFCEGTLCHVNLIQLNNIENSPLKPSPISKVEELQRRLSKHGVETTIRKSRGGDIDAACGQLKQRRFKTNES